ncbi:MAG: hypothetical protein B7Y80_16240 [Hyphomicrobium sp. 32-62-53]|nr:MAG: hypothetical protein B7Z29_18935 [Hyphomicrobium sp. 12-62-95]OYX98287.1 MAG: hypothetical protein B7Y80_16240 [Hyphomicrobium sp. 32-62-53]
MILRPLAPVSAAVETAAAEARALLERRFAKRKAVATNALIVSPDISVPLACMVRDISPTGARLELIKSIENPLGGRAKLPGTFTINLRLDRMEVDCGIVWRNGAFVGVRFLSTPRTHTRNGR